MLFGYQGGVSGIQEKHAAIDDAIYLPSDERYEIDGSPDSVRG